MGFFSFLGRVLFASIFILSAWQMFNEFGNDGGPSAKELIPKVSNFKRNVSKYGIDLPDIDVRHLVAIFLSLKGIGGLLFVLGSSVGAYLLLLLLAITIPLTYDFFNYAPNKPQFGILLNDFLQNAALFGALLFFIGMKNSSPKKTPKKKGGGGHKTKMT